MRLGPIDEMIILAEALAFSKVGLAQGLVESGDDMNTALLKLIEVPPIAHEGIGEQNITRLKQTTELTEEGTFPLAITGIGGNSQVENGAA